MSISLLDQVDNGSRESLATGISPAARLRATMAACRVSFTWFGTQKTLTREQKERAAEAFDAEGASLSAGKKLLDTTHPAYRAVTAVRGKVDAHWRGLTLPYPEAGVRLIRHDQVEEFAERMTDYKVDLDDAVLVRKEKERLAAEMAEAGGGAVVTPPEPSPKKASEPFQGSRNLLAGEDARKWTIVRGDWTTDNNVLTGAGNSSIVFTDELSPPFTLQFKINVLEGMRPRVRFGPFEFGNEGFETTFALYPKPTGELFHYQRKTSYGIAISVSQKSVDLSIDGNLIASRPGVKEKLDKLDFLAGDNWSKGRVEFRDITLAK